MDDWRAGNHAFNERGGMCVKCGMSWNAFWDKDSPQHHKLCTGNMPEQQERMSIDDE